ncbi:c-type cytochrome [Halarcobacter ebronensis]|uniref:Cytochrome C n=1 Tax=Halarcobacter ebronensis TaxID=1462615 RepID=A0A4Q1AQH7_9BACT|nr:c-type cytochrome [Halarcobacter ebronensis]QKF82437.1 cytochrome c [Halarcobacter ebronensis]RXK07542.1 cytochrome C [Halarcobacter ebronensis]
MKALISMLILASFACMLQANQAPKEYPTGEVGRLVKLGEDIVANTDTHPLTKDFVGNKLQCKSCHLKGADGKVGTGEGVSSWVGTAATFPAWSKREKTVQTLQDRSNNCFMRSMNGKRLIIDSEASIAIAAYITWLSEGTTIKMNEKGPWSEHNTKLYPKNVKKFNAIQKKATHQNYLAGQEIYAQKCATCHGTTGAGIPGAFPPLWGKDANGKWLSYNTGAGMSKLDKAAAWVQSNMPLGQGNSLTDQETADVVLYMNAQERAPFDLKEHLLPKEEAGVYNSKVFEEKHTVESNFKILGLDLKQIKNGK